MYDNYKKCYPKANETSPTSYCSVRIAKTAHLLEVSVGYACDPANSDTAKNSFICLYNAGSIPEGAKCINDSMATIKAASKGNSSFIAFGKSQICTITAQMQSCLEQPMRTICDSNVENYIDFLRKSTSRTNAELFGSDCYTQPQAGEKNVSNGVITQADAKISTTFVALESITSASPSAGENRFFLPIQ